MTLTELMLSLLPLAAALAVGAVLIRKTGAFEQRAHRQRVVHLLERIAVAVEKNAAR